MSSPDLRAELEALHVASFGWAMACCGRARDDAEDVLQSAYFKVLAGRARYDGRARLKTWLFGVIRVTASEHRRRRVLRALGLGRFEARSAPPISEPIGEEALDARRRAGVIAAALAQLPVRQREVLHLVFYEDLTVREAAEVMAVSGGTASLHYDRGKKRLLELLEQRGVRP